MGFKFKRVDLVGGSEEFPNGNSYAYTRAKAEVVIKKVAQAILDTNTGWVLDSRNPTITSFSEVPDNASTPNTWPGLFFYNSTSGCKLFLCCDASAGSANTGIKNFSGNDLFKLESGEHSHTGVIMSMIPGNSSSVFGNSFDSSFLPSDATRLLGTATGANNFMLKAQAGYYYSYGLFVTNNCIGISAEINSGSAPLIGAPSYFVGKIFKNTLHSEDENEYGIFKVKYSTTGSGTEAGTVIFDSLSSSACWGTAVKYVGSDSDSYSGISCLGSFAKQDGTWIHGTDATYYCVKVIADNVYQLASYVNDTTSGKSRWCPFLMAVLSTNLSTYCVVSGDGVKGYLDTDLFRCAVGTYGQQFDNGNFICVDGTNNLLIGWDPNSDPLVGT